MNKTLLIFKHEFLHTIRRTGFIVLTLAPPVLALLGIGIYQVASRGGQPAPEASRTGFVDEIGTFREFTTQGSVTLIRYDNPEAATQALLGKEITQYFVIPPDFVSTGTVNLYSTQAQLAASDQTTAAVSNFMTSNLLAGKVAPDIIARVETPVNIVSTTLTSDGTEAPQQAGYVGFIVAAVFSFLLALSLIFSSNYVLQSLSQEKENRLMEILVSSVSTRQLLAGKLLGLGATGLMQVLVWVISFFFLLNLASSSIGAFVSTIQVPFSFCVLGIAYFILGYSLYGVLPACLAAISSTLQDVQGLAGIYSIFSIAPFWFLSLLLLDPNNPVWVVFSIFPFSGPVLVMMRLGLLGVPAWQLAASMAVLIVSIVGGLLLAGRLLRVYMLMYGKRPSIGEVVRNLRS